MTDAIAELDDDQEYAEWVDQLNDADLEADLVLEDLRDRFAEAEAWSHFDAWLDGECDADYRPRTEMPCP